MLSRIILKEINKRSQSTSLIKNNHELYYTDFDIFSIPTAVRKRLFDGYVEEYRENANVMKNTKQMGKWFR